MTNIAVQINGKLRATLELSVGTSQDEVEKQAKSIGNVQNHLAAGEVKRVIYVQDRLINFVVA